MKKLLTFILVLAMVLSVSSVAMAITPGTVAMIGSAEYASLDAAITAANGMAGNVTVEIYGKVEYSDITPNLTGAYDSISFEGKTSDAEISITRNGSNGYISGTDGQDCTVSFTDLKCSKPAGGYAGDAGFMNVYFTVYRVGNVSYTRCTFPDGACCQGKKATYTNCTFNNTTSGEYSLWVYAGVECIVENCTFSGVRGVKMYTEPDAALSTLKIIDSIFENTITEKAAVVLTKGKSIELSGNTYNNPEDKGTVEVDGDYYSDIDGKAEVIIEGKKYKVGEGEATSGAVLKVELPVAKINGVEYTSLKAAMDAAAGMTGNVTIELLDDVEWEMDGTVPGTRFVPDGSSVGTITINGSGKTFAAKGSGVYALGRDGKVIFKDMVIDDQSFYTYENGENAWEFTYLEFDGETEFIDVEFKDGILMEGTKATFTRCTFSGHNNDTSPHGNTTMYGVWVANGDATFTDCLFEGTRGLKVHEAYGSEVGNVIVDGCTFKNLSEKPGIVLGTLNRDTTVAVKDSHFMNCKPGDQGKHAYETDTEVTKFNFTFGEDNHICKGENKTTDWQTVKEPTATEDGLKVKLCLNNIIDIFNPSTTPGTTTPELCHYIVEEEIIPALGSGSGSTDSSKGSGISVKYNGGNSFSTSKSDVPTGVEIDGVPVTFNGTGSNFTVGCISSDAKWVTVRWNSTTVTTNFTPDGLVECTTVSIPKTGDMSFWAAIAEFLGF